MGNTHEIRHKIYTDLRIQIMNGDLKTDEKLVETQIAAQYTVNKSNVRSALQALEKEQLVTYIPMRGFYVKGVSKIDLIEIGKIREVLETAIIEAFLEQASEEQLEEVKIHTLRKISFLKTGLFKESFHETKKTFAALYRYTPYLRMVETLLAYEDYIDMMISYALGYHNPQDATSSIINTELLYRAFDERDPQLAREWSHKRWLNIVATISNYDKLSLEHSIENIIIP